MKKINILTAFLFSVACLLMPLGADVDQFGYRDIQNEKDNFLKALEKLHGDKKTLSSKKIQRQLDKLPQKKQKIEIKTDDDFNRSDYFESVLLVGTMYLCDKCDNWHLNTASGFAIREDGYIVTSYHVVDPSGRKYPYAAIGIRTYEGEVYPVKKVINGNKHNDVVILKVDVSGLKPLKIAKDVNVGDLVTAVTHPDGYLFTVTKGSVNGKFIMNYSGNKIRSLAITADFAKGSSGGPILNENMEVVGIVRATSGIYYTPKKETLQMVWKLCVPSVDLLELVN